MTTRQQSLPNFSVGRDGELAACHFLQSHGYQLLDTNVRLGTQELDIIALDRQHDEVVFVEVKTRSTAEYGDPSLAVTKRKLQAMKRVAAAYLKQHTLDKDYRFDIISILPGKIEHFENITWPS